MAQHYQQRPCTLHKLHRFIKLVDGKLLKPDNAGAEIGIKRFQKQLNEKSITQRLTECSEESDMIHDKQIKYFNLGNGVKIDHPIEAAKVLARREYRHVVSGEQNEAQFVPETLLTGNPYPDVIDPDELLTSDEKLKDFAMLKINEKLSMLKEKLKAKDLKDERTRIQKEPDYKHIDDLEALAYKRINSQQIWSDESLEARLFSEKKIENEMKGIKGGIQGFAAEKWIYDALKKLFGDIVSTDIIIFHGIDVCWREEKVEEQAEMNQETATTLGETMEIESQSSLDRRIFGRLRCSIPCQRFSQNQTPPSATAENHTCEEVKMEEKVEPVDSQRQEFDFLIVSVSRKVIIHMETKSTYTAGAFRQLGRSSKMFEQNFSDILDDSWQFGRVACFYGEKCLPDECADCAHLQPWIITRDTDICSWWKAITDKFPKVENMNEARNTFIKVFEMLLFAMHANTGSITTSKTVGKLTELITGRIGTVENISFWSKVQLPLLNSLDVKMRRVIFRSGYGTGKTLLMREKLERLAKDNQ